MSVLLKDKVVVVSGIGPGLGIKLAVEAAREGAWLVAAARSSTNLEMAKTRVAALGLDTPVLTQSTDIQSEPACQALIEAALARFGRIDALINSAFRTEALTPPSVTDVNGWRDVLETNLLGTMRMSQAVIEPMRRAKQGAIVMVGTLASRQVVSPNYVSYAASKAGLATITRYLAHELGPDGIRVNIAYPGFMLGDPVRERYLPREAASSSRTEDEVLAELSRALPLRRVPTDDECARSILFLASDYASACTGAALDINGGEYMPL